MDDLSHDGALVEEISTLLAIEGMLLESARGPLANVAQLVAGEPIRGSWWAHPQSHRIFATINALADSPDVARMRLVNGRITLVHRRLWPALLRLEARFPPDALVVVIEEHTPTGAHRVANVPLASWVGADVREAVTGLDERQAMAMLPGVLRDRLAQVTRDHDADQSTATTGRRPRRDADRLAPDTNPAQIGGTPSIAGADS